MQFSKTCETRQAPVGNMSAFEGHKILTTLVKQKTVGGLDKKDFTLFDKALKLN